MSNWIMTTEAISKCQILVNLDDVQAVEENKAGADENVAPGCALTLISGQVLAVDESFETFRERVLP